MSSACSCGYEDAVLGSCLMGPRIARSIPKRGNCCGVCGHAVEIGETCIDLAGLYYDESAGFFVRMHAICFELMTAFVREVCGNENAWTVPFELDEAAQHATAHGDEPVWREWLFKYEQTWREKPRGGDHEGAG